MNVLTTTWRQLVRRRLWPVALLLVAALVAVPMLLTRDPEPPIPAPVGNAVHSDAGAGGDADETFAEPVVAKATSEERSRRRRVLGSRKDPFAPDAVKHPKKQKKAKPAKAADEPTKPADEPTGGSSAPSGPSSPTPVAPAPKPKVYEPGSLIVRFGDATGDLERMVLKKLGALPKDDQSDQLLIYTGLKDHGKKAVFLVDASLEPTGDGTCKPHPSSCETIELSKGETEFFDLVDPETGEVTAQFELDIVDIK
jgi:hypothetical protein